jgi:hypothetical protein
MIQRISHLFEFELICEKIEDFCSVELLFGTSIVGFLEIYCPVFGSFNLKNDCEHELPFTFIGSLAKI